RLKGMFAIAVWDTLEKKLTLARDRFGIKPLYYYQTPTAFLFGSEIKSILATELVDKKVNYESLGEYIHFGNALGSNTLFLGIKKLLPGHILSIAKDQTIEIKPYASIYDFPQVPYPSTHTSSTVSEQTMKLFENAVQRHLVSDRPVGVFLSGGIDSGAIVAIASKHYTGRLSTYSAGFDYENGDELHRARLVAKKFGTEHHELNIRGMDLPDTINQVVRSHDLPFGDPASIPLHLLCKELQGSAKVVLQGDGGDEIFGGYDRYQRLLFNHLFRAIAPLATVLQNIVPARGRLHRSRRTFNAFRYFNSPDFMGLLMSQESVDLPFYQVFAPEPLKIIMQHNPMQRYQAFHEQFSHLTPSQRMMFTDSGVILPDIYFEKVDRATMAFGIEARIPMVDQDLARYVMSLPESEKISYFGRKLLLRKLFQHILPKEIIRGPKLGFGVPIGQWLRTSLLDFLRESLMSATESHKALFQKTAIERAIAQHTDQTHDHSLFLYKLLMLSLWLKHYQVSC
ncbi:MAG: asparagine synthase (glutamine-hydrolyzing), partial [Pseudomonadales bacterium]|nr:asparagine synthase (glutamine-hydrolyzing) [Pseudomonadales bacterium]